MKHVKPTRSSTPPTRGRFRRLPILIVAPLLAVLFAPQAASAAIPTKASAHRQVATAPASGHSAARQAPLVEAGFSTFGTISTSGAVVDRFGVGFNFDAQTFASQNVGYGTNLFYYLRHDSSGFSTFGTISTSGAVVDRFGVGFNFDALTFASQNVGYGTNLFYYLRHA
ncbi:MAG: hypothetical protein V7603_2590 [Micromonosporaceae bacterium]